ncbi:MULTISPECIES: YitT family protein [unclassified Mucilaginibacter]|uniref:YitT family protein n=1 Tax=unclassified Mucilaginibacter TaxID=2617802 RepID=UPI002AC91DE3|nr:MULTISPECIES: YitT family protein [unclassified Mucilaginibacter]MEB0279543.1 YitT family protein [Mucilaginibacter sp. 10B2]MEB0302288.1 YitT family protein [Mucilaginibacter sp. 5C4]WPX22589.1 YitT family protein [Mucilaginibacter sp. 5C4]
MMDLVESPEGKYILDRLRNELPVQFHYHNIDHTLDVYRSAAAIAQQEDIDEPDTKLLLIAALYHDSGYLKSVKDHEMASCHIAREALPQFGYDQDYIEQVCKLIMATQLPQQPTTLLEQIICDADLDYLGRQDFIPTGNKLFKEMQALGSGDNINDWDKTQVSFLQNHHYFTPTSLKNREPKKQENLRDLQTKTSIAEMNTATTTRSIIIDTLYAIVGILFCGFALKSFLIPNAFFDGGVTGISLLIHELYHVNIAYVIILANIPFIIMGALQVNKTFAIRTMMAIIGLALCLLYLPYPDKITSDKLLVSIFGGVFMGTGIGLAIRGGCALDGIEVLALYTGKRISFTISEIILGINVIIFLIAALEVGFITSLYSIITYYTASRMINFVIEGLEEYTGVTIISGQNALIKEMLVKQLSRGITVYKGERGFLKESFDVSHPVDIVFTVVTRLELRRLRNMVHEIDPKAFIFTSIIKEAAGGVLKRRARH